MGLVDFAQEWKQFRQSRNTIVPYTDDQDMVKELNHEPPHFFPWTFWRIPFFSGICFCLASLIIPGSNFIVYGYIFSDYLPVDLSWIGILCLGGFLVMSGILHYQRFMAISAEGISIPKFFRSNRFVSWSAIQEIFMQSNILETDIQMKIYYDSGIIKTGLPSYKIPYLSGSGKPLRLLKVVQMYLRTQIHTQDIDRAYKEVTRDMEKQRSLRKRIPELLVTAIVTAASWITGLALGIQFIPRFIILICVFIICQITVISIRHRRALRIRKFALTTFLVLAVCILIITLTLLVVYFPSLFAPLFSPPPP